ncbi:MAG: hypothetical protein KA797_05290 [Chitinophagales bacterium]|nr:hypothetical protein [Chitinophagales bacterium]
MEKYKNKYRNESARLQYWDYGSAAMYFITICTQNREHFFGTVGTMVGTPCLASLQNQPSQQMELSPIGKIAESEWLKTFELRPDMNLYQGEFVVMPNHFHAIIGVGENRYNINGGDYMDAMHGVPTKTPTNPINQFRPQSKNLASIIRGFKSSVTIAARKIDPTFKWQSRYHDHIIRDEESFQRITNYIIQNPAKWVR